MAFLQHTKPFNLQILPYSDLQKALDISNVRELEDLIIDAIYLDLLKGKLDQKEEQLEVSYTMGRDLEPGKLEQILAALKDWCVNLDLI
jgi:COP9 signalosome complex subunit 7